MQQEIKILINNNKYHFVELWLKIVVKKLKY